MEITEIEVKSDRRNETLKSLWKGRGRLIINYYWDSHGRKIPWEVGGEYSFDSVKPVSIEITQRNWTEFDYDWETINLVCPEITESKSGGTLDNFELSNGIYKASIIVGWG